MKVLITLISLLFVSPVLFAQDRKQDTQVVHLSKLEVGQRKKHSFPGRDSIIHVHIDTLIMKDRAQLVFHGKKEVYLTINHATIGKNVSFYGNDGKNNGADFTIDMRFDKLGQLYVLAGGMNATNGFPTHPNGDGGEVKLVYDESGITPQTTDRRSKNYLRVDTRAGGYSNNAESELRNIYSRIDLSSVRPLGGLPQGTIYSGSPGRDGSSEIMPKNASNP